MPSNIEDDFRRLSVLLLQGPRDPRKYESPVFRLSEEIIKRSGFSPEESPVIGVAMYLNEKRRATISVFLTKHIDRFGIFLSEFLKLDHRIEQLTTGQILPTARPAKGGESLGRGVSKGQSGTFGCLVADAAGENFLLSCHHVLCEVNSGKKYVDPVWQPSFRDGGQPTDKIGVLYDFSPIALGGVIQNQIDAAIAKPDRLNDAVAGIKALGPISGTATVIPFELPVKKYGWKTSQTNGTFLYRTNYLQHYPGKGSALFWDQLGIYGTKQTDFSQDGDSGSVVLNDKNEAVGLVFANSKDTGLTFANPISSVFSYFGVTPV